MQDDEGTYLLLILSDANLPTGSFVASAGLESTATHALFHAPTGPGTGGTSHPASSSSVSDILAFLHNSVDTYARSALPFARDAHRITCAYVDGEEIAEQLDDALAALARLDALYDASTLNHVARRASCAQGAALLTLYAKGFARPPPHVMMSPVSVCSHPGRDFDRGDDVRESRAGALIAALKLRVRRGESDVQGHLPVCWGVLTGALGLTVGKLARESFLEFPPAPSHCRIVNFFFFFFFFFHFCYFIRSRSSSAPLPSCARRALRGGANEHFGPVCRAAGPSARGEAHAF